MITAREKKLMLFAFAAGVSAERKERRNGYHCINSPLGMAINWATQNGQTAKWQTFENRL